MPFKTPTPIAAQQSFLITTVGDFAFAFPAAEVEEVRSLDALNCSNADAAVVGSTARRGQHVPVVDAAKVFGLQNGTRARIVLLRRSDVAVAVTSVDRIRNGKLLPLPSTFSGSERQWYSGLAVCDGNIAPLLRPEGLLSQSHPYAATSAGAGVSL